MLKFLCKFVPFGRHIAISSSVFQEKCGSVGFRNPFFYVKFISTASNEQSFTVSYLINTCGFSPQRAASASKHLHLESREKPDLVIKFFENQGFSRAQALKAVRTVLSFLRLDPEKYLLPKIEFLKSKGVLSSDIPRIILTNPNILKRSLEKHIIPASDILTNVLQSDKKFVSAIKRFSGILVALNSCAIPNMNLLRAEGVSESLIIKLLEYQPRSLSRSPHQFKTFVEEVKEMGFKAPNVTFVQAILTLTFISKSTWTRKSSTFKRWGWTNDITLKAFRRFPLCMALSEKTIEEKMEFFVHRMGCKSSSIARRPQLLALSLDKRLIPRNAIIGVLLTKGLVTKLNLRAMFECSEVVFVKRYILCHEKEANEFLKLYRAKLELSR